MSKVKLGPCEIFILCCVVARTTIAADDESSTSPGVLYFGFFYSESTASSIKSITDTYFNVLLSDLPEFSSFLNSVSSAANVTNPKEFYTKPVDPNTGKYDPLYHTTAKYCGEDQVTCSEYEKIHINAIDTKFEMHLIGYVLTAETFGIRVDLTDEQRELFDEGNGKKASANSTTSTTTTRSLHSSLLPGDIRWEQQEPFPPTLPATMTKAHVTLGCAPGVAAVVTGYDAVKAIEYERNSSSSVVISESWDNITDPIDGNKMRVTLFKPASDSPSSDYIFVIYPHVKLFTNATLARYYQKTTESAASKVIFSASNFNLASLSLIGVLIVLLH